jgi:hypothetical protein
MKLSLERLAIIPLLFVLGFIVIIIAFLSHQISLSSEEFNSIATLATLFTFLIIFGQFGIESKNLRILQKKILPYIEVVEVTPAKFYVVPTDEEKRSIFWSSGEATNKKIKQDIITNGYRNLFVKRIGATVKIVNTSDTIVWIYGVDAKNVIELTQSLFSRGSQISPETYFDDNEKTVSVDPNSSKTTRITMEFEKPFPAGKIKIVDFIFSYSGGSAHAGITPVENWVAYQTGAYNNEEKNEKFEDFAKNLVSKGMEIYGSAFNFADHSSLR